MRLEIAAILAVPGILTAPSIGAAGFTLDHLLSLERVSDVQVSPDGTRVAFTVKKPSLEKNSVPGHIEIASVSSGERRRLTNHEKGESRPRWSPDGKRIAFLSSRGGSQQIWVIPIDGGEAKQVTSLSTGADGHIWSPTGGHLAFTSDVWPDLPEGDAAQKKRAEDREASGVKARVIDRLLYRHWNEWRDGKRTHVFLVSAEGGAARDLTPGDFDCPPFSLGGPDAFAISPDGKELAFTRGPPAAVEAWSTNADLLLVPIEGGPGGGEPSNLTAENRGWDGSPVWSPDGQAIAYRSQARDGYESDRFRLAVVGRASGRPAYLAADVDRSVDEVLWGRGGTIHFTAEDEGSVALFALNPGGLRERGPARRLLRGAHFTGLSLSREGSVIYGELQSLTRPAEAARLSLAARSEGSRPEPITRLNDGALRGIEMPTVESVKYPGAGGAQIQAWLLKPPGFVEGRRHPFLLFIHGGPQSSWQDAFSFRWNAALYASRGYVVLLPNFHGSTGFGQAFTEEISGDWAGAAFEDLMKGADWAVERGLADPERMAAMGGSFGGYMVNWILGHTDRFKALVSHAGVYNLDSMYGTTEELWFPEWDLRGAPWKNEGDYERFSPHRHAARFRTPTLVIHGELDFRVAISEGLQLFTALKRQGVESKLLYFPDEGHWILKPKNSKLWNETVLEWLGRFLKPEGRS